MSNKFLASPANLPAIATGASLFRLALGQLPYPGIRDGPWQRGRVVSCLVLCFFLCFSRFFYMLLFTYVCMLAGLFLTWCFECLLRVCSGVTVFVQVALHFFRVSNGFGIVVLLRSCVLILSSAADMLGRLLQNLRTSDIT